MKKKKKQDYSIYLNILFIGIFMAAVFGLYIVCGKKDAITVVKETEKQIQESKKIPVQNPLPPQNSDKNLSKKDLSQFQKYKFNYTYTLDITGFVKQLKVELPIPVDEKEKQYISDFKISPKPSRLYNDGINTTAEFILENLETQKINIVLQGIANVRTYNLKTAKTINMNLTPEKNLERYLKPENLIESGDSYIKSIAGKIPGGTKEEIVQNIYEYIRKNLNYKIINVNIGAKKALQGKYGKCTEYAAAMTALCRAKNIPARLVIGNIAREQMTQHNWVEVYFEEFGWVSYDPSKAATVVNIYDSKGKLLRQEKRFDTSNENLKYIISGRNIVNPCKMGYSVSDQRNGKVSLTEKIKIEEILPEQIKL